MKKNYIDAMQNYTEAEKKPVTDMEKFVPQKPGRKENRHEHYFTGEDDDKDPNEKNSILPGKAEEENEDKDKWNEIQKKKDKGMSITSPAPPPFADVPDSRMVAEDKPGLWENIRKKKEREGKNYKPAKPGDSDRPDQKSWKEAQK
jgi:hypothetical protein